MDITIETDLEVYCTKKIGNSDYRVMSVLLDESEIIDLIKKIPNKETEIIDLWMFESDTGVKHISVPLDYECEFNSDGELYDVSLCCESINDVVTDGMTSSFYREAVRQYQEQLACNHHYDKKEVFERR